MAFGDLNKIFSTAGLCSFSADARISLGRPQFARHCRRGTDLARCAAVAPTAFPPAHCFGSGKIRICAVGWLHRVLARLCCLAHELRLHCSLQVRWDSVLNLRPSALPRCFLNGFLSFPTSIICFYALDAPTALCNRRAWSRIPVIRRLFRSSGPRHARTRPQFSDSRLC